MAIELKNTVEHIVDDTLAELLKSREDICKCTKCLLDMKAYSLNRLPCKYIVSERGFIHSELDNVKDVQFNADVIGVIFEAIDTISSQIRPGYSHETAEIPLLSKLENSTADYFFNFPHLLGFVYINDNLDFADDVSISLFDNKSGQLVEMMESSWKNPTKTHTSTMGLFSFWPKPLRSDKNQEHSDFIEYKLVFEKEGFKTEEKIFQFKVTSEQKVFNYIRNDLVKRVPAVILAKK